MLIDQFMYELAKIFELMNIRTNTTKSKLHDRLIVQEEIRQVCNGNWKSWYASTNGTETNVQCSDGNDSLEQQMTIKSKRKLHCHGVCEVTANCDDVGNTEKKRKEKKEWICKIVGYCIFYCNICQ